MPVISLNVSRLKKDIRKVNGNLEKVKRLIPQALGLAMAQYMEHVVSLAQAKAPVGNSGDLRGSNFVTEPTVEGGTVSIDGGFNIKYARMRDRGGIIRPVRAKALFIPLRPGAVPVRGKAAQKASGQVLGRDFQLVPGPLTRKRVVRQKGNRFWTSTLEETIPEAPKRVGDQAMNIIRARLSGG